VALLTGSLCNVLESVTLRAFPQVTELKSVLLKAGAPALMSGSGPTVFALAEDENAARRLAVALKKQTKARVWVTRTRRAQLL
jgi:4-diphosphocytidyl-2-C-methyl-D-erythritol kinase